MKRRRPTTVDDGRGERGRQREAWHPPRTACISLWRIRYPTTPSIAILSSVLPSVQRPWPGEEPAQPGLGEMRENWNRSAFGVNRSPTWPTAIDHRHAAGRPAVSAVRPRPPSRALGPGARPPSAETRMRHRLGRGLHERADAVGGEASQPGQQRHRHQQAGPTAELGGAGDACPSRASPCGAWRLASRCAPTCRPSCSPRRAGSSPAPRG